MQDRQGEFVIRHGRKVVALVMQQTGQIAPALCTTRIIPENLLVQGSEVVSCKSLFLAALAKKLQGLK